MSSRPGVTCQAMSLSETLLLPCSLAPQRVVVWFSGCTSPEGRRASSWAIFSVILKHGHKHESPGKLANTGILKQEVQVSNRPGLRGAGDRMKKCQHCVSCLHLKWMPASPGLFKTNFKKFVQRATCRPSPSTRG